ncbi:hypothetical protein [Luedemannella helvata]|uniref:Uncharacterized protein n=1 Tax=Luedemannella helvata TaxID=349315 RepID=A0ABN2JRB3_9ACTN
MAIVFRFVNTTTPEHIVNHAIELSEEAMNVILPIYMIGGILLFITSFLPGNKIGWRIFSAVAGIGVAAWAGYVWLFGGRIIVNLYIAVLPFILAGKGIIAMIKRAKEGPAQSAAPHHAASAPPPYGAPGSPYGTQAPGAAPYAGQAPSAGPYGGQAPSAAPYGGQPQGGQPGYPPQQPQAWSPQSPIQHQ